MTRYLWIPAFTWSGTPGMTERADRRSDRAGMMRAIQLSLLCLLFFGCQDPLDTPETHRHAPTFYGVVRSTPEHNHIELYVHRSGLLEVYLYDEVVNPVPTQDASGTFELTFADGSKEKFPLVFGAPDHHDMLQGQINKPFPTQFTALVDVTANNTRYRAKFQYDLNKQRDKIAHMHDARQGGQVAMIGDQHVELVSPTPGEYRVYLSDMHRGPLSPTLAKNPSIVVDPDADSPETLPLAVDPSNTFLQATGQKNTTLPLSVRVNLTLQDKPGLVDFLLTPPKKK